MAREVNRLNARQVATLKKPGMHSDGNGLYLAISKSGAKSWRLIFQVNGKRRELGLGPLSAVSLADARSKRDEALRIRQQGLDPAVVWTQGGANGDAAFGTVALEFISSHEEGWKNEKHRKQWRSTPETYAAPIWQKPVSAVNMHDVLAILRPIWISKPETARRVRGRIEMVLDAACAKGLRTGGNPARLKGNLDHWLPRQRQQPEHHDAMPYEEVPAFFAQLSQRKDLSAKALRFTILTAARTGEVLGATWDEFDLANAIWTIPAARMKGGEEHRVALSATAITLLEELREMSGEEGFVFPGMKEGRPLSNMVMLMLLRRMGVPDVTVHGFRSTFRDWAGDTTDFPREVVEQALSHRIGNAVERAYRRGDALNKRKELMDAWALYLATGSEAEIG